MRLDFGVGCFEFVPTDFDWQGADSTSPAQWQAAVEGGLGELSSITNLVVNVTGVERAVRHNGDILADNDIFDMDYSVHPSYRSGIAFDVVIPKRIHSELLSWSRTPPDCENFRVYCIVSQYGPVTFIRALTSDRRNVSEALMVALVREFLEKELSRLGGKLKLITQGPSPFHADFAIIPKPEGAGDSPMSWMRRSFGYDEVYFYFDPEVEDIDQAYMRIIGETATDLSLFYYLARVDSRSFDRSRIVVAMSELLIQIHSRPGAIGWIARLFRSGSLARGLLLAVISTRYINAVELEEASRELVVRPSEIAELQANLQEELKSDHEEMLKMAQESAQLLEGGRSKEFEILVLAVAALLGGAAGALASFITP